MSADGMIAVGNEVNAYAVIDSLLTGRVVKVAVTN